MISQAEVARRARWDRFAAIQLELRRGARTSAELTSLLRRRPYKMDVGWHNVAGLLVSLRAQGIVQHRVRRWAGPRGGRHYATEWYLR